MGKRYFCDYCNSSFPDTCDARKKHMKGHQHVNNRKMHYLQFKSKNEIVKEELMKTKCRKYFASGECLFGPVCIFSHYSDSQLKELEYEAQIEQSEKLKELQPCQLKCEEPPTLEKWIDEHNKSKLKVAKNVADCEAQTYQTSPLLANYSTLPPSLIIPSESDMLSLQSEEWG